MSSRIERLDIVYPSTSNKHTGTVFFLHGSGGTGEISKAWVRMVSPDKSSFPHLKIIYPTAPRRPYTPLNGKVLNIWFDRSQIIPDCPERVDSIDSMAEELHRLIKEEINSGIPANRIVVGGFSQGGSMALHLAYRFVPEIAGVFSLSSFLNDNSIVYKELEEKKPEKLPALFVAHGDKDDRVELSWGQRTFEQLNKLGVKGVFKTIPSTFHQLKGEAIDLLFNWITQLVPNN